MKRKEKAVVYSHEKLAEGVYSLWIETSMAKEAKAGLKFSKNCLTI